MDRRPSALVSLLVALALLVLAPVAPAATAQAAPRQAQAETEAADDAFSGQGMWIHELHRSERGDPAAIIARAKRAGISTLIVKAAHGHVYWPQFSASWVAAVQASGLRVCAYQRLQSDRPVQQARTAARAVAAGADCFVIDAEAELERRYRTAEIYMDTLRPLIGDDYPLGLTSFPFADVHPDFPYSVFLRPGGATYNLPQIYWKAIGVSVDAAFARTYLWNALYGREIQPLGQLYDRPSTRDVMRFRELSRAYGANATTWWVWQHTTSGQWSTLARPLRSAALAAPRVAYPALGVGARGDAVRWLKDRLTDDGQIVDPGPRYTATTARAVRAFQGAQLLPVTGTMDTATWRALLDTASLLRR